MFEVGSSRIFPSCNKGSGKSDRHTDSRSLSRERDMAHKQNAAVGYTITISSVTAFRNSAGCPLRKWCFTVALFLTEWLHTLSKSNGHWHPQNIEGSLSTRNTSCSHSWHGFCMSRNCLMHGARKKRTVWNFHTLELKHLGCKLWKPGNQNICCLSHIYSLHSIGG